MSRTQIISLGAILILGLVIATLALRNPQPPFIPTDEAHVPFENLGTCIACHGSEGVAPTSENHPLRNDCLDCHAWR